MAIMIRGNCEITIAEHLVGEYLKKGYSLLDANGKVVQQAEPQNIGDYARILKDREDRIVELQAERDEIFHENAELTEKVAALEAELEAAKAAAKPAAKKSTKDTAET